MFYTGKIESFSNWFNVNWTNPLNGKSIFDHLFLVGTFTSNLNNVVWTLVHEIRISLVFPIIMFILVRMNLMKGIGLALGLSGVSIIYASVTNASFLGNRVLCDYSLRCNFCTRSFNGKVSKQHS